jgi:prepilin-type processing-associated H-X9-DG protein
MKRATSCLFASISMVLFLATAAAHAQPLADRIPQDAVIYVGWSGSEAMGAGYAGSHLKAVIDASNLAQLVHESIPRLLEKIGKDDEEAAQVTGLITAIGGPMWRHPSALYFGGVDVTNPDFPMPKLALICDAGKEGKQLVVELDKLITSKGQPPFPYRAEEQDGLVVVVFGNVEISAKKKPVVPITQRKEFKAALAEVGKDPVVMAYVDVEGGVEQMDQAIANFAPAEGKQKWPMIRDAIGISTLKRLVWSGAFDGQEWASRSFIEAPEPRAGLVKALLDAKPLSEAALKSIPKTATMAAAGHFDFGGLLGTIREMVKKIDAEASGEFEQGLDQVKQAIGMDLQSDILDTLGDEWAVYSDPTVGGTGVLGTTLVNHLKDSAKADKAFSQLEQLLNGMMKEGMAGEPVTVSFNTSKQGDLTIHYLAVPFVAPSWAIKDGNLYVGLYPQVVSGAAEHVASNAPSILENAGFAALRKRLGGEGITAISFNDLPKNAAEGYQDVLMLSRVYLGMADLFGAKTPALVLPPLSKLMPHVTPAAAVAWSDKNGWHLKQITPFPGSDVLAMGGMGSAMAAEQAMTVGVLLPSLNRARGTANMVKSASNMRMIGQAMLLYANENKGNYPKTMGELLLTQDVTIDVFVNPQSKTRAPREKTKDEQALWVTTDSDYEYLGAGKNNQAGADVILAHEKFRPNVRGVNMLYGDGHVEFTNTLNAQQMLAKQKQDEAKKKGAQ